MTNTKRCIAGLTIAVALFLAAGAVHAQTGYWPNGQPYACTYVTQNGTTGTSLVTISLGPGGYGRSGTITTVYPNGSTVSKPVLIVADIQTGSPDFTYQEGQSSNVITCTLNTAQAGRHLVFSGCSNGAQQDCRQ